MNARETAAQPTNVPARDGFPLAATVYRSNPAANRVVIVNSATAVPQGFYRHYARALADAGYIAVTYDYRGIGESRPPSLRGFKAAMRDWGMLDMAGVVDWAGSNFGPERLFMVGHSVGGQLAGLLDNSESVDAMLTLSAQSGHWRVQGGMQKLTVALHVHVSLPLLASVLGYMPWSWFGPGEDLPRGVALEWSRWCRDRLYLLGDRSLPLDRYAGFAAPVLAYSVADDDWGTREAVDAMMAAYPNVERQHLEPGRHGMKSLGHVGYFRSNAQDIWAEGIRWFDSF
ncbi:MAG: alpha/beta fold hydrolase [Pseudomonadota bacterium]